MEFKAIHGSEDVNVNYLLSLENKEDDNYYIIQMDENLITIYNLAKDDIYKKLVNKAECNYISGFIFNKDYLWCSSFKENSYIWGLNEQTLCKDIPIENRELFHIIQWNNKYSIIAEQKKSFKVIDLEEGKIIFEVKEENIGVSRGLRKINDLFFIWWIVIEWWILWFN